MKSKIIKISLFCIIVVLVAIGFYKIADYEISSTALKESALGAEGTSSGVQVTSASLVSGETNPNTYNYNVNVASKYTVNGPTITIPISLYNQGIIDVGSASKLDSYENSGKSTYTYSLSSQAMWPAAYRSLSLLQ